MWLAALFACLHPGPPAPAVAAGTPFTARYLGAEAGLGLGCVVFDAPPHGRFTVHVEVMDSGATDLVAGERLCAIVHSPAVYTSAFWSDGEERGCALAGPGQPRVWACGEAPSGGVFSRADLDRLLEAQQAPMRELAAQMDALQEGSEAYATAWVAPDAGLQEAAASLLAQLETIHDLGESELLEVVRPVLNQVVGQLRDGAQVCAGG